MKSVSADDSLIFSLIRDLISLLASWFDGFFKAANINILATITTHTIGPKRDLCLGAYLFSSILLNEICLSLSLNSPPTLYLSDSVRIVLSSDICVHFFITQVTQFSIPPARATSLKSIVSMILSGNTSCSLARASASLLPSTPNTGITIRLSTSR